MREFQEKNRYKKYLYSKVTIGILIFMILIAARATWNVLAKEHQSAANALQAQSELNRLTDRQELLGTEINKLSTDDGIDEAIRQKFGVSKPGEEMIVIVEKDQTPTTTEATTTSWWGKVRGWFK